MDQLIFASLSHIHYRYEVGMLKVPAVSKSDWTKGRGFNEGKRKQTNVKLEKDNTALFANKKNARRIQVRATCG